MFQTVLLLPSMSMIFALMMVSSETVAVLLIDAVPPLKFVVPPWKSVGSWNLTIAESCRLKVDPPLMVVGL